MNLPHSYSITGDILILNQPITKKQAQQLLKQNKSIKVIAQKTGIHKGKYRLQKLKILAGEKRKTTTHKESGCLFNLDVEKCYFSPRLSNERLRIAKQIKKGESILVMFSGVGVFPIILSKHTKAKEIYAIEINPIAHKYAEENINLNKVKNVKLFKGDVKSVLPKIKKKFDRILMPLPKEAYKYFDLAKKKLKKQGTIHLYSFSNEKDFKKLKEEYSKKFKKLKLTKCGQYGPSIYRICLDLNRKI